MNETRLAPAEISIRYGEESDLARITAIYNQYVVGSAATFDIEPRAVEQRREWFSEYARTGRYRIFVAMRSGEVVAYAHTRRFRDREAYDTTVESTVYCAPDAVGQGIATRLYEALFEAVKYADVHLAIAAITLPNPGSVALHQKFGFVLCGVMHEVGRKFDKYWDVATYEKRFV